MGETAHKVSLDYGRFRVRNAWISGAFGLDFVGRGANATPCKTVRLLSEDRNGSTVLAGVFYLSSISDTAVLCLVFRSLAGYLEISRFFFFFRFVS